MPKCLCKDQNRNRRLLEPDEHLLKSIMAGLDRCENGFWTFGVKNHSLKALKGRKLAIKAFHTFVKGVEIFMFDRFDVPVFRMIDWFFYCE